MASKIKNDAPSKKLFFKIGEVCEVTDTQPYVLRFWESEFPQLAPQKNRSGQRMYRQQDIEVVGQIKRLLHDEGYTIAGARKRLEQEVPGAEKEAAAKTSRARKTSGSPAPAAAGTGLKASGAMKRAIGELREVLDLMRRVDSKLDKLP